MVIQSEVYKQFGDRITEVVNETLAAFNIEQGLVVIDDKGALDCVIRARVQAALLRGAAREDIAWETL